MSNTTTAPQIYASIYPFEGGKYNISGNNACILRAQINSSLRGQSGDFSFILAPGGPYGPNATAQWIDIITPMSLVVIGLARGNYRQIVMIGIVLNCEETEVWNAGKNVQRGIKIAGADFGYFFQQQSYYTLSFLAGAASGELSGSVGFESILSTSQFTGPPDSFGAAWYQKIMAGPDSIMNALSFNYETGRIKFYDLMAQFWQPYDANVTIPVGDYFMLSNGTWSQKFNTVFPFPYYEFFVTTAPADYYGTNTSLGAIPATTTLQIPGFPVSVPQVVARINPVPWAKPTDTNNTAELPPLTMDSSLWNSLPLNTLDENAFSGISKDIGFSDQEVANFFVINPTWLSASFGLNNGNNSPFIFTYAALVDTASIHRYGYRPVISEIEWFSDPTGAQAQAFAAGGATPDMFDLLVSELSFRQSSWYEPVANMARGSITMRLRPDIFVGSRFAFSPYKIIDDWEFYVEGVSHSYEFGGQSTTSLMLSRGLPATVYADSSLMLDLHTGNAQRVNGSYVSGVPSGLGPTLAPVNYQTTQSLLGGIANIFNAPQYAGS